MTRPDTPPAEPAGRGRNPLLPLDLHLPDCEPRVMPDGRLYLYGSWDKQEGSYCSDQYLVVSTADLRSWTRHPVSFDVGQVGWADGSLPPDIAGATSFQDLPADLLGWLPAELRALPFDQFLDVARDFLGQVALWAPDVVERDGRYHLYFCLSDRSEGVATASRPEGPFGDPVRLPATGIDPAVFIDDDGSAYYYWGQFSANAVRLGDDMRSYDEDSVVHGVLTTAEHNFHEGISVRRRGDTYYCIFTDESRGKASCLGYATSRSPLGPFTYRGVIIDNDGCDPQTWNNHGSIAEFDGRWYVFYHRSSRNSRYMRRVCAEPITFTADGSIPEVPMTSQGVGEPLTHGELVPAAAACQLSGTAFLAPTSDDGAAEVLTGVSDGDSATFRYLSLDRPASGIRFTGQGTAEVEVWIDGAHTGTAALSPAVQRLPIPAGRHELRLVFRSPDAVSLSGFMVETDADR